MSCSSAAVRRPPWAFLCFGCFVSFFFFGVCFLVFGCFVFFDVAVCVFFLFCLCFDLGAVVFVLLSVVFCLFACLFVCCCLCCSVVLYLFLLMVQTGFAPLSSQIVMSTTWLKQLKLTKPEKNKYEQLPRRPLTKPPVETPAEKLGNPQNLKTNLGYPGYVGVNKNTSTPSYCYRS